jgi:hypothetical protein
MHIYIHIYIYIYTYIYIHIYIYTPKVVDDGMIRLICRKENHVGCMEDPSVVIHPVHRFSKTANQPVPKPNGPDITVTSTGWTRMKHGASAGFTVSTCQTIETGAGAEGEKRGRRHGGDGDAAGGRRR